MKRNYKIIIIVIGLSIALWSFIPKTKEDPEKDKLLLELLAFVIEKGHYSPAEIDDTFSKGVYKEFLKALDPTKRFFLQSDIDEFAKHETTLDDEIKNKELTFFNLTYSRLKQRIEESKNYYKSVYESPIDYKIDEEFNADFENLPFASSVSELKDKWRKQIKLSALASITERLKLEENIKNGLPSDSKDSLDLKLNKKIVDKTPKTFEQIEKETRESSLKSMVEYFGFIDDMKRDDWFAVFINTIAERFDPHTSYFAPEDKERFDVSMSGTFFGIGAKLQKKNDFTEITELISGGPAWRGKELEVGDIFLKVAQEGKDAVDVVGMRIDDVVKKIKGPKGTEVSLTIKKTDGSVKVITLTRDEIEIEETYLKSSIVEKNGLKYGVIYLPKFYINFGNSDARDAGKDMTIEVERLKKAGVNGIVLDVRDDGGGSLKTVVDIAGLFVDRGPIVQIKSATGQKEVLSDNDRRIQWDGPLVVMINSFSASASEILAAAIQDYKRGIIIGSKQSYGKGTVQNVIDLNKFVRNTNVGDLGALKTTTQKFYRINGGSTQLEGVSSDVVMPDKYSYVKMGERDVDNAMPWDKIDAAEYTFWNKKSNFNQAIANSKKRLSENSQFKLIDENAKWINKRSEDNVYSLQIEKFQTEQKIIETTAKKYKTALDYKNQLKFNSLPYEIEAMKIDLALKEKRSRWHESLSKDIYVDEALNVLGDLQTKIIPMKSNIVIKKKDKLVKS